MRLTGQIIVIAFFVFCAGSIPYDYYNPKITRHCGKVTYKGNKDQVNKYRTETEFIMVIEYPEGKRDEIVSASTWSSHSVGDSICFSERAEISPWIFIPGVTTLILSGLVIVIGLVWGLVILFVPKNIRDEL